MINKFTVVFTIFIVMNVFVVVVNCARIPLKIGKLSIKEIEEANDMSYCPIKITKNVDGVKDIACEETGPCKKITGGNCECVQGIFEGKKVGCYAISRTDSINAIRIPR